MRTLEEVQKIIANELIHAEQEHPIWPSDPLRQVVIVCEEAGEALKAGLNMIEFKEDFPKSIDAQTIYASELRHEMIQTAAMATRWLMNNA